MATSREHPFHHAISEVERALGEGACPRAVDERIARLQAWLDGEASAGWLADSLHGLLSRHVEELRQAADRGAPELTLAALATLDEAATPLHASAQDVTHA